MEESKEEWKGFVIRYSNRFYEVINTTKPVGGKFTTLTKAREFIDRYLIATAEKEWKSSIKEIKKIKDLKERSKEYKKLCQTRQK